MKKKVITILIFLTFIAIIIYTQNHNTKDENKNISTDLKIKSVEKNRTIVIHRKLSALNNHRRKNITTNYSQPPKIDDTTTAKKNKKHPQDDLNSLIIHGL